MRKARMGRHAGATSWQKCNTHELARTDTSLLQEKISLALADALRAAYGTRYATLPVETRARAMRAGANYLRAIGVTERTLPDTEALAKLIRLTIDVMRQAG